MKLVHVSHEIRLEDDSFRNLDICTFGNEIVIEFWDFTKDKECPISSATVNKDGKFEIDR